MRTAVILAAGFGSRLKGRTQHKPKGFLELEGISLIDRSIARLRKAGIERLIIGTGYLAEHYDELIWRYKDGFRIETCLSEQYESTSSMYTLFNLRGFLDEDFLLLESDLLYEQRALTLLLEDPRPDLILVSGYTGSRDEVWIEADEEGNLKNLSKDRSKLETVFGELVGISKISRDTYRTACDLMRAEPELHAKLDYEGCLLRIAQEDHPIPLLKVDDLTWCEIDDEGPLTRALTRILPSIKAREA
jgi:2-aminoethylphosphonate-pyruvate transaminase